MALGLALGGCGAQPDFPTTVPSAALEAIAASGVTDEAIVERLGEVAKATAYFAELQAAIDAGYESVDGVCYRGAGVHYGRRELVDAVVDPLTPEILMYQPDEAGELRLIGVEYIVPKSLTDAPPAVLGQTLDEDFFIESWGEVVWLQHVWLWKPSPSGIFSSLNPLITC